jgi:poly-gamma-glutamate synthesis protein (capsule biosynthesis protein)
MPGHRLAPFIEREGPSYPWARLGSLLSGADVLFFNLEVPIGATTDPFPKKYNFLLSPSDAETLRSAGVRPVAALANNHILDNGPAALAETFRTLDRMGVPRCGAGRDLAEARTPAVIVVGSTTIAFLAYSHTLPDEFYAGPGRPGTAFADPAAVRQYVAAARARARTVVVAFHWGTEYDPTVFEHQKELARAAVEAGADLVVGHHAHTVQGSELVDGKPVVYGLGNFIFGTANEKAKGALLVVRLSKGKIRLELIPLDVNNFRTSFQTGPFTKGPGLDKALDGLQSLRPSLPWRREGDRLVWP